MCNVKTINPFPPLEMENLYYIYIYILNKLLYWIFVRDGIP